MKINKFELSRTTLPYVIFTDVKGKEFLLNRSYNVIAKRWMGEYNAHLVEKTFNVKYIVKAQFLYTDANSPLSNKNMFDYCYEIKDKFMNNEFIHSLSFSNTQYYTGNNCLSEEQVDNEMKGLAVNG